MSNKPGPILAKRFLKKKRQSVVKKNFWQSVQKFRVKNNTIPKAFENKFEIPNFIEPKIYFKATKITILSRRPRLWSASTPLFKRKLKNHLVKIKNVKNCF